MTRLHLAAVLLLAVFTFLLAYLVTMGGISYELPPARVRELAVKLLEYSYKPGEEMYTVYSPEAVTAVVWDYRGLDTLFETAVFYLAVVGCLALARGIALRSGGGVGLSLVVKTATRVVAPAILVVAGSLALHGQLTPGGGFQAGATAAVAVVLLIAAFSLAVLGDPSKSSTRLILVRCLGLIGVGLTALGVFLVSLGSGFVFQNQPKPGAPIGYPRELLGVPTGGSLLFFNVFECMAVMAGFSLVFLLLAVWGGERGS